MSDCPAGDRNKAEALKALNRTTIFGFGKQAKYEDAYEYYKSAANAYKLSDCFTSSGECYMKAAECTALADPSNATGTDYINMLIEAAGVYKRVDIAKSIETYAKAIQIYCDSGRLSQAARYQKEVAEMLEADHNVEGALAAWERAADLYAKDNKKSNAKECNLKVATMVSTAGASKASSTDLATKTAATVDFQRAAALFEDIARASMESKLGAYSAKGYLFQSLLCTLALGDSVAIEQKLTQFKNLDYTFPTSRECQFVEKLVAAIDAVSTEDFANACSDFDAITPLDPWKTSMLLTVKTTALGDGGAAEEGDLT